jgi:hypothetical protein
MYFENWVLIWVKSRETEKYMVMCPPGPKTKNDSDGEGQQQFTWPTIMPCKERQDYHASQLKIQNGTRKELALCYELYSVRSTDVPPLFRLCVF